jgi:4-alpha-glucanotransferase
MKPRETRLAGPQMQRRATATAVTPGRQPARDGSALPRLAQRASGILLHPSSLPGPSGIGDLGRAAYEFVEFLAAAGQSWWQMLPAGPVGRANSPYQSESTFAGNPLFVSLEGLAADGLLAPADLVPAAPLSADQVSYAAAERCKEIRFAKAFAAFESRADRAAQEAFERFRAGAAGWLGDFALYRALKDAHAGAAWADWPPPLRDREPAALREARERLARDLRYHEFLQFAFDAQWRRLRAAAAARGIGWIGDLPIFVSHDSAEVWAHRDLFELDPEGRSTVVAGVPPDYFSADGQLWGNPLYRWERMAADGYAWWLERFRGVLERFDAVRVDHFIGFTRYWEIPAGARTARRGRYREAPGGELLERLHAAVGDFPIIAEDLGILTPEVVALCDRFALPGMRVLQFAFGGDDEESRYMLPENYPERCVAYTGTHDNDTSLGWFREPPAESGTQSELAHGRERERAALYFGGDGPDLHWRMIGAVLGSRANTAIVPLQDVLGLGSEARMNRPGTVHGNWRWRFRAGDLTAAHAERLRELTAAAGRLPGAGRPRQAAARRAAS